MQVDHISDLPQQPQPLQRANLQVVSLRDHGASFSHYTGCTCSACCTCFGDDDE